MSRRALVVVLDACGVGALPDAADYGDAGANTLAHIAAAEGGLRLPTLQRLGLGSILALEGVEPATEPAIHGRLSHLGPGKDSTSGHWELMGLVVERAPPTYPRGFPPDVITRLAGAIGRPLICNAPYNGVAAIDDYGEEHLRSGHLIVYTSQDSVLQLAGHVDRVSVSELYAAARAARQVLRGDHAVGRVIARPFRGEPGRFERTEGRRDFALAPPGRSYLEELRNADVAVHAVGKVGDLFAGVGIECEHRAASNASAIAAITELLRTLESGLVFANLIETDQVYGHRGDSAGFHAALREIDAAVAVWLQLLRGDDLLVLTSDHGCDPTTPGTDHTREHALLLAQCAERPGGRHDGALADVGATALRWLADFDADLPGRAFV